MKERVTSYSNRIARHFMIGIMMVSILFTVNKTLASEDTVYVNGNRAMNAAELKPIVTFLNSRVNNGFILSTYNSVAEANLEKILYNNTKDVSDLVEQMEYLRATSNDVEDIKNIGNKITSKNVTIKKITLDEIKNFYHDKTGINLSDNDIKDRLKSSSFTYLENRKAFYIEEKKSTNYLAIQAIEGMATSNGKYLIQVTSSTAQAGDRATMYQQGDMEIVSTTVTLKPQDGTYFVESNVESNEASLLYDNEIYTGYDNLDVNDLDYDFTADYIGQYEQEEQGGTTENISKTVVVVPKSNVPTALIISGVTVGIIVVLGAFIIFINKKFKPKKFDIESFRYEERERSDNSIINQYNDEDFDEMEAEIEEMEIHNSPANEEEAEREIEALAEARMKGKPLHTAFDNMPKKRGRKPGSKNKKKTN